MGSIISKILDDYDDYVELCRITNEIPVDSRKDFYAHEKVLMKKHNYIKDGCWYKKQPFQPNKN